jgi:hypothetical protein
MNQPTNLSHRLSAIAARLRRSVVLYGPTSWRVGPLEVMEDHLRIGWIVVTTYATTRADEDNAFRVGRDCGQHLEHKRAGEWLARRGLPALPPVELVGGDSEHPERGRPGLSVVTDS